MATQNIGLSEVVPVSWPESEQIFTRTKLAEPEGSDLTIDCNGETFYCHRSVLCQQCEFFNKALSSPFKEAKTGTITMVDDEPVAAMLMLEFLYTRRIPSFTDVFQLFGGDLANVVALVTIADKYEISSLRDWGLHIIYVRFFNLLQQMYAGGSAAANSAETVGRLLRWVHGTQDHVLDEVKKEMGHAFQSFPRVKYADTMEPIRKEFPYLSWLLEEAEIEENTKLNALRYKGELDEDEDPHPKPWKKRGRGHRRALADDPKLMQDDKGSADGVKNGNCDGVIFAHDDTRYNLRSNDSIFVFCQAW